ncbi:glycosyltransferase [Oryzomonas japonica]|uniref:Glycosyltransferase n=1 Tax=Oryzomonas japonica TaxID=2603858 RepID=A0A7J4ZU86_9BACT|nr:glycosyltransferase [Oryzomonas japonica]KAB0666489.1 glycosyltransferase [Oryzomonas japonica]
MPKVSVVITCYNYGKYLDYCLGSVLGQTFKDIEIIVIDDGSSDNTEEVMSTYVKNPLVSYIKQENKGQAAAKNVGVRQAQGDFVAFLDADDLWDNNKLEMQMALFSRKQIGVVYSCARYIDEQGRKLDYRLESKYLTPRSGKVSNYLFLDNFVPFSSSIVRKRCLENLGLFDESLKMGIDWDLWLRISTEYEFDFIAEPLLAYRIGHSGQMSKNQEERQRCSDRIMQNFLETYPGLLSPWTIREAYSITFCNRGEYYRPTDRRKSTLYFWDAVKQNPVEIRAYKGLVKNILYYCDRLARAGKNIQ